MNDKSKEAVEQVPEQNKIQEIGGRKDGTEPVNEHGEWVKSGKCVDF